MSVGAVNGSVRVASVENSKSVPGTVASPGLLPAPETSMAGDDVLVSLAVMMVKLKQDERASNDRAMHASARAQETAHARKIEKMHELADDTLMEGIVAGALGAASAVASAASAVTKFSGEMKSLAAEKSDGTLASILKDDGALIEESKRLARNAGLLDAASKGFDASARLGGSLCKNAQERARIEMAEADAAKDAAKASVDAASATSNRASEDIRATVAALRQLMAARTQLANAAIIRG